MPNEFDRLSIEEAVCSKIESEVAMLNELLSLLEDRTEELYLCLPIASVQEIKK